MNSFKKILDGFAAGLRGFSFSPGISPRIEKLKHRDDIEVGLAAALHDVGDAFRFTSDRLQDGIDAARKQK